MGHPRPSRRTRGGKGTGHHQRRHWHQTDGGGVQQRLPKDRHALHLGMECAHTPNGLLGGHGSPVRDLPHQIHGVRVVVAVPTSQEGHVVQGVHHPAVQPHGRHGVELARTQPTRHLPRRQGHHHCGPIPRHCGFACGLASKDWIGGRRFAARLPGLDDHAVDVAFKHRTDGGAGHRLRRGQNVQPVHRDARLRRFGRGTGGQAIWRQEGPRT